MFEKIAFLTAKIQQDKVLSMKCISHYCAAQKKEKCGSKKLLNKFSSKDWSRSGFNR